MANRFEQIWQKSKTIVTDNQRVKNLLEQAGVKIQEVSHTEESKNKLIVLVKLLIRMVRFQLSGKKETFSARTLFMIVFAIAYFVIPTDLIPDFIPMLGFTDDLTVLYYVTESIRDDIEEFKAMESEL